MFRTATAEVLSVIGKFFLGNMEWKEKGWDSWKFIHDEKAQLSKTQQHGRQDNIIKTTIKIPFRQPEDRTKREESRSLGCMEA